ncbi:MAG: response regulator [Syntrophaceae bacterium]|nr:response regulator [Deltaproteobacteria bacterium]
MRTYLEYLRKNYPDVDIHAILEYSGLTRSELDDDGYWFTQEQGDRFHTIMDRLTHNSNIAREVGRYNTISASYGTVRQYLFGFIEPSLAYELLGKIGSKLTRGTKITINKISSNRVEAIFDLNPGVQEKPYSCLNRLGTMEATAMPFIGEFATVEHTECIHKGASCCRYFISWNEPVSLKLKRLRNYLLILSVLVTVFTSFFLSVTHTADVGLSLLALILGFSAYIGLKEKQNLRRQIEHQSLVAEQLMAESNRRYSDAELIQELGQAISSVLNSDELLETVMSTLNKYLEYDRGMILLANTTKTRLIYKAGYGYTPEQENFLRDVQFHLDKPDSKGPFVVAFKDQKPYLIDDIADVMDFLSPRTKGVVEISGARSFICVPIVYENESFGVLSLDNTKSPGPPKQSDLNLLLGIAPQIAISINNIRTFEKMQASEEKYRELVESANSIILRIDMQGRITFANLYAQDFYGYAEEVMLGKNIFGFLVPEKDFRGRDLSSQVKDFLRDPEIKGARETENILKSGERVWVSWSNKIIHDPDGVLTEVLCVGNDITARKKAEQEKKQLETQLIRAQKMEAIGALAGGVAHDLNNILSGITSYPELLLMEIPEGSPMRKAILTIKKSGDKAAAIVQDLLTLARRGVNISNVVDPNTIVKDYIESPEFRKLKEYHPHVEFVMNLDENLKCILGSEIHLGKTVMNLISNAAEAMSTDGTVTVSTDNRYLEKPLKGYDTVDEGEYAVLSISDTGVGISPEDLKRIFEPFFSKKVMGRSGTGLGMTVVWSTVKDHNGYIDVESVEGKGSRFDLYFPVTNRLAKGKDLHGPIQAYSGTERVLVVDDAEEQRDITRNLLKKLGYVVEVAGSGEDALAYLSDHKADLVILDMIMDPGMDGLGTYREILEIRPGQKAIIVSGFSESDRVREALRLGAGAYIRKPYALTDLARAVRTELDRS